MAADLQWEASFTQILYRPFDIRAYFHNEDVVELSRNEVMRHILQGKNKALVFMRQVALQESYSHFFTTINPVDNRAFFSNKGTMSLSPLYLYPDPKRQESLFDTQEPSNTLGCRRPNIAPSFITAITEKLNMQFCQDGKGDLQQTFGPENIFDYIYAVFHSPTYRERYTEFLKIDFPRLPLTSSTDLFRKLCQFGEQLGELHLMEKFGMATPN